MPWVSWQNKNKDLNSGENYLIKSRLPPFYLMHPFLHRVSLVNINYYCVIFWILCQMICDKSHSKLHFWMGQKCFRVNKYICFCSPALSRVKVQLWYDGIMFVLQLLFVYLLFSTISYPTFVTPSRDNMLVIIFCFSWNMLFINIHK